MNIVYIGLGSNIKGPVQQLERAIQALGQLAAGKLVAISSYYSNPPMGLARQPDYVNAVVCLQTTLAPVQLLDKLQAIEARQGRKREYRWGPRSIDLDILLYGQITVDTERLKIPHPGLCERNFVLYPLQEIAPELEIPGRGKIAGLVKNCEYGGLRKLSVDIIDH
jgi:2-amino-4-hydroxy-6-hydroxymethyldihydropteridine diphosphokinase